MTELKDHQFEILPSADANDGFVFGIGADVSLDAEGFDPGETSWLTQDKSNGRRGVNAFGRDVPGPKVWSWQTHTDQVDVESAVDVLERFTNAWQPEDALIPGWQTAVRYRLAGRDRRIFGRPRRFAAPPTNLILNGFVPIDHDFQLVDAYTYDDLESSVEIAYSSSVEDGGFTFPVTFPIQTMPSTGTGGGRIFVGGTARAYPRVRFNGPWVNPGLRSDDWTLAWNGTVPASGWIEIDCRPWGLTVLNQDGASVVGGDGSASSTGLDRRTWLEDCWFAPGSKPVLTLGGIAPSGSASATVAWRNTHKSI